MLGLRAYSRRLGSGAARRPPPRFILALAIVVVGFLALAGSTVDDVTVQYDELTDLRIASSLAAHPLSGSAREPSQARLPMYVVAAAARLRSLARPEIDLLDLLPLSRWLSLLATAAAIVGLFLLGARLFDHPTALLGAALFGFSPYTLHFGRDAMTQGDAFTPAVVVFSLLAFCWFEGTRSTTALVATALSLGIAIATKFFLAILIPALVVYDLVTAPARPPTSTGSPHRRQPAATVVWPFVLLALLIAALACAALIASSHRPERGSSFYILARRGAQLLWLLAFTGLALTWLAAPRLGAGNVRWHPPVAWLVILLLAGATSLAICPAHALNPQLFAGLFERFLLWDGEAAGFMIFPATKLYLGLLLFKLGLPLGIATCLALAWSVPRARTNQALRLILFVLLFYGSLLLLLPLFQPYWLMSAYPLLILLLSEMLLGVPRRLQTRTTRVAWRALVALGIAWLAIGLIRVYPTFGYYGYEVVRDRWLGEHSRGYRGVVVITNDGSAEAIAWLRDNAPAGSKVMSYLDDTHVVDHLKHIWDLEFDIEHVIKFPASANLTESLEEADFVVLRTIADFGPPFPAKRRSFLLRFGNQPVHEVSRGRGRYRMAVYEVYRART